MSVEVGEAYRLATDIIADDGTLLAEGRTVVILGEGSPLPGSILPTAWVRTWNSRSRATVPQIFLRPPRVHRPRPATPSGAVLEESLTWSERRQG